MKIVWNKPNKLKFTAEKTIEIPVVLRQYYQVDGDTLLLGGTAWEGATLFAPVSADSYPEWYGERGHIETVRILNEIHPKTCYKYFDQMINLVTIEGLENLYLDDCVSMYHMFRDCQKLEGVIKFGSGSTKNTNLQSAFKNLYLVTSIDATGICPSTCVNLNSTFYGCWNLKELKGLDTFQTENVTAFNSLFRELLKMNFIDGISNWDTSKGLAFNNIFDGCNNLIAVDLHNWWTPEATTFSQIFRYCYNLVSIDFSNLTTETSVSLKAMFYNCYRLVCIKANPLLTTSSVENSDTFYECHSLQNYDWEHRDATDSSMYFTPDAEKLPEPEYFMDDVDRVRAINDAAAGIVYTVGGNSAINMNEDGVIPLVNILGSYDRVYTVVCYKEGYLCSDPVEYEYTIGESLDAPTISISDDNLTITNPENVGIFRIYISGLPTETIAAFTLEPTTSISMQCFELEYGTTYTVKVMAKALHYCQSDYSNIIEYTPYWR